MSRQLKRWESPRREGRNHKGRGGSARQRQKRKQLQALRQQLKSEYQKGKDSVLPFLYIANSAVRLQFLITIAG